jgi:hypothetical protein
LASDAAIMPFPKDDVTPPVTKIYLAIAEWFFPDSYRKFKYLLDFKTSCIILLIVLLS